MSAFGSKADITFDGSRFANDTKRTSPSSVLVLADTMYLKLGGGNEASRVHQSCWRCSAGTTALRTGPRGRIYRLAIVTSTARDEPPTQAFLDELRVQGFVEGKNLEFVSDGFRFNNEQAAAVVPAIIRAAPDAM